MARVLERQAVQDPPVRPDQGKRVEDLDRPGMPMQELPEVCLAQPAVNPGACLDAEDLGDGRRATEPAGQIHLAEAALAEHALDGVAEPRLGAGDDLPGREQALS